MNRKYVPGGRVGRGRRHSTAATFRERMASSEYSGTREGIESEYLTKILAVLDTILTPVPGERVPGRIGPVRPAT